jgi:hypothetical protein
LIEDGRHLKEGCAHPFLLIAIHTQQRGTTYKFNQPPKIVQHIE